MKTVNRNTNAAATPTDEDIRLAKEFAERLARMLRKSRSVRIQSGDSAKSEEVVTLPSVAAKLLGEVLSQVAEGSAVSLLAGRAELTTQQAADYLNVSRPFLIKLIDRGEIPCRLVGRHRRVRLDDLMRFQERSRAARAAAIEKLVAEGQELDMGY